VVGLLRMGTLAPTAAAARGEVRSASNAAPSRAATQDYADVQIASLGQTGDSEVRRLLRRAIRDAWKAARHFGWRVESICELAPHDGDVGYTTEDGTVFVKVRDPNRKGAELYPYSFVLATLLHELTHLSVLGHGKAFYCSLSKAASECGAEPAVRREVRAHICGELLNAVCDNDARRARALLSVLPEAVSCRPPGPGRQLPLEYAAHHGRVALTKLLLEAKADADGCCGADAVPPLARAAAQGNAKTMKVLLEAGAVRGRSQVPPTLAVLAGGACDAKEPRPSSPSLKSEKKAPAFRDAKKAAARRCLSLPSLLQSAQGPILHGSDKGRLGRRPLMLGGGGSLSL